MKEVKVDGCDAVFWETQSPVRPNTTWRQWSFVKNGESFTIVSALDNKNADILWPQVQEMVASFHVTEPPPASPSL
jgi:hypothetical protein